MQPSLLKPAELKHTGTKTRWMPACSTRIPVPAPEDREDRTDADWELLKYTFFFQEGKTYGWLAF